MSNKLAKRAAEELVSLAVEIREEHEACEHDAQSAVERAINCGRMLIEAKGKAGHGNWLPWLKQNFPGHINTASNYMRMAANSQRVVNSETVREALAELAEPRLSLPTEEEAIELERAMPNGAFTHLPAAVYEEEPRQPTEAEAHSIRKQAHDHGYESAVELAATWGVQYPDDEPEEVDAEIVDDEPSPPTRSSRTDVVAVMGTVLLRAEEAATNAQKVNRAHLANRPEAAATWARELSEHVSQLQRLLTLLEESSND